MPRRRVRKHCLTLGALNIHTEPENSSQKYVDIFTDLMNLKLEGRFDNERLVLEMFSNNGLFLFGNFRRYTHIDEKSSWWDSELSKNIEDEEGNPIPQVRKGVGPNSKAINFVFYITKHKLVVDLKNIRIKSFRNALTYIFNNDYVIENYGVVNADIIPDRDALDRVLAFSHIQKIEYTINIPNPDISTDEEEIFRRMNDYNIGLQHEKLVSQHNKSIIVDDKLKKKLNVAQRNGIVKAKGKEEGGTYETRSTADFPKKGKIQYEADLLPDEAFRSNIEDIEDLF